MIIATSWFPQNRKWLTEQLPFCFLLLPLSELQTVCLMWYINSTIMTVNIKPQILTRSSAEQRFDFWGCDFPMELPWEPWRVFPCQKCMMWHVGHVLLLLTCTSQSLSCPQLGLSAFSVLSAQHPCMRRYHKPQCKSKTCPGFAGKSSGRWKKQ